MYQLKPDDHQLFFKAGDDGFESESELHDSLADNVDAKIVEIAYEAEQAKPTKFLNIYTKYKQLP